MFSLSHRPRIQCVFYAFCICSWCVEHKIYPNQFHSFSVGSCGNLVYRGTSGLIYTPNYPNNYDNEMSCVYTLQPRDDFSVRLHACDCYLEDNPVCRWDSIRFGRNDTKRCGTQTGRSFYGNTHLSSFNIIIQLYVCV